MDDTNDDRKNASFTDIDKHSEASSLRPSYRMPSRNRSKAHFSVDHSIAEGQPHQLSESETANHDAPDHVIPSEEEIEYPSGMKVALIMVSLYLAMFLVALVCTPNHCTISVY